ncbi:MAG: TIGR01212 family radical SAM protein [Tannerella sp.]|jgi:radical SAM protein (TIGR01212 family)|nr:TIGR01212 family radical SAM protein [Tannerella sp.]
MKTNFLEFNDFLRQRFPDFKVQKISIDAGFTCPNRDGTKSVGGCTYCDNRTFNPEYCQRSKSITEQLEEGKRFFARKYPDMKYLAYFQAYSNTYAPLEELRQKYEEALAVKDVVGLIIGTRPDCVSDETLDYLAILNQRTFVMVEYGVESTSNETLRRINRQHTYEEAESAVQRTAVRQIPVGAHIILGLPGESREQILSHADKISQLPLMSVKLHQLQIIRHTRMAAEYAAHPENFHIFTADEYIDLVLAFIRRLRKDIYIDRLVSQSPKELLIAPDWGLKNHEFMNRLRNSMIQSSKIQFLRET